jgi:flagellar motor switch/type III secretory pathway protein FliN
MLKEGRIADNHGVPWSTWEPEAVLPEISEEKARYSRGFLAAQPIAWFPRLPEFWLPLFHTLALDVFLQNYQKTFEYPENLSHAAIVEVDGERAFLGFDDESRQIISQFIIPGCSEATGEILLDYLQRRLLSTLEKSWSGREPLRCYSLSLDNDQTVELAATVGLNLEIAGEPCLVWFGMGPRLLEKLNSSWRSNLYQEKEGYTGNVHSDEIHSISIEVAELAVPPAMLIDYVRSGTVIDLEIPVSTEVRLRSDGKPWMEGNLCRFQDRIAVEITSTRGSHVKFPEGTTRLCVEIAQTELDQEGMIEHAQVGAVLLTETLLDSRACLIVSGENVATAMLGEVNGNFAVRILPK